MWCFFFFKQKTAYEMRISDWSSDVCSSDLWPRKTGVRYEIDEWDGSLVALTDRDDAFDMQLLRLDPKDFRTVATLVPHRAGTPILSILPFKSALVRLERAEELHRLVILRADGSEQAIAFDDHAYALKLPPEQAYDAASVLPAHQSPKSPRRWNGVAPARGTPTGAQTKTAETVPTDH